MNNIKPANRLNSVQEYWFSTKLKEIAELKAQGKDIVELGVGGPDMPPSDETIAALCQEAQKSNTHGYQSYVGIPELRRAFADWYRKWFGVELNPNTEVQPLIGSKEGIMHISLAFLNAGDGVLVPNPGYPTYSSVSNLVQARVIPYELSEAKGWYPDFEALERLDLSGVKLMWVNYPNMPTGAPATRVLFEKLVAFGKKHNIVIVNDNPYSFVLAASVGSQHFVTLPSILAIDGAKDICIELNSMSKSHNMAGWRMGVLATNAQFMKWILQVKTNMDSGIFRPMQVAAVAALNNSAEWHKEFNYDLYARRRVIAEKIMQALGCTFDPAQVGLFLWGRIPEHFSDSGKLADKVLYESNVFITPGFIFGSAGKRFVRISLCATEERLQEALERIAGHGRGAINRAPTTQPIIKSNQNKK
ncbi:MAG: aminotransferase class I/II-fold pyridoxal phosphate-dependent enzyme [Prevotellaceae bacterium]|jgi:aspartate/methionine/tyrosine aminotransferase|nr:aminotransferase class I/II-fold pyridoxal phosphate-dependent enzyme [Prevotellaceae bacterium]